MKDTASYYAIIPANIRYCKGLCANAKLLYGEITALCNREGYCWATNTYFAKLYSKTKKTISIWINTLEENGFVKCSVKNNNMRRIYLTGGVGKNRGGGSRKIGGGIPKNRGGYIIVQVIETINTLSRTTKWVWVW